MNKKILLFGGIGIIIIIVSVIIWQSISQKNTPASNSQNQTNTSTTTSQNAIQSNQQNNFVKLADCDAIHQFNNNDIFCLQSKTDSITLNKFQSDNQTFNKITELQPKIYFYKVLWGKNSSQILLEDFRESFWLVQNNQINFLDNVIAIDWYKERKLIAVVKKDFKKQLVILNPTTLQTEQILSQNLTVIPNKLSVSPDNTKIIMLAPTDIADENIVILWQANKSQRLNSKYPIKQIQWLDNNRLLVLNSQGISILDLASQKTTTLIKTNQLTKLLASYQAKIQQLAILDPVEEKIYLFNSQSLKLLETKQASDWSSASQIYLTKNNKIWIIQEQKLYQLTNINKSTSNNKT